MATDFSQAKTEAPTQRRREEASQEGQIAVSPDLNTGVILLVSLGVLVLSVGSVTGGLTDSVRLDFLSTWKSDFTPERIQDLFLSLFCRCLQMLGFFLGMLFLAAWAVGGLQAGFHILPNLLSLNWEKLSPANGWNRIFSGAAGMRSVIALLKLAAVVFVAYWVLKGRAGQIGRFGETGLANSTVQAWTMITHLTLAIAGVMAILGSADYVFQRWRLETSLRMTRQELKEELKREEGDPLIKARIRKLQREAAQKRMMEDVPKATVVITNPTHLAVALSYQRGAMGAPKVVAKGAGFVALRIMALARRHAVPVVERKLLAQALFKAVKIGQEIPAALYYVVAEVLAYIYRLRGMAVGGTP